MTEDEVRKSAIVRILSDTGEYKGTGFLVSKQEVATCAHVLTKTGNIPESHESPPEVKFFVQCLGNPNYKIKIEKVIGWGPDLGLKCKLPDCSRDLAILKLAEPASENCHIAELSINDVEWDDKFWAFGYPAGYEAGQWTEGKVLASEERGYFQIQGETQPVCPVTQGYSGTPVWRSEQTQVLGIVSLADPDPERKLAFMIPVKILRKVLQELNIEIPEARLDEEDYKYDLFISYPRRPPALWWLQNCFYELLKMWLNEWLLWQPRIFIDDFQEIQAEEEKKREWPSQYRQGLKQSRCMLAVISPSYFKSPWCVAEWKNMIAREKMFNMRIKDELSGLILPVLFWENQRSFQEMIEGVFLRDLHELTTTTKIEDSKLASELEDKIRNVICEDLAKLIQAAPPYQEDWQIKWPVELPHLKSKIRHLGM